MKAKKINLSVLLLLIFIMFSCREDSSHSSVGPNVILVFMDDMGYGDLECYGHPLIKTPHLNKLANSGIRFTSFYAPAAVCSPSRAGLLTGRYPIRNVPHNFGPRSENGIPLTEVTIADILKQKGYRTAAIGKWHLGHKPQYLPTARGFDMYYGLPYSNDMILPWCPWLSEEHKLHLYEDSIRVREVGKNQEDITLDYTNKAIDFIEQDDDQPFFLYLAHSMPHLPISTSSQFIGTSEAGLYGDVIETIDWTIGEIYQALEKQDMLKNTIFIFTSDNGPWHNLPDRMVQDGIERWHTGSAGLLRGAKGTTYEGGFRVPAIISWQGKIAPQQVNTDIVCGMDILPTLATICGAQIPDDYPVDGIDISPLLLDQARTERTTFFFANAKTVEAVRQENWKLRYTRDQGIELFDLLNDPSELFNRAETESEVVEDLISKLTEFAEEVNGNTFIEQVSNDGL